MPRKIEPNLNEVEEIEVKGKTFTNVKNISKFKKCTRENCEYYYYCKSCGVTRLLDCRRISNRIIGNYSLFTGIMLSIIVLFFYYILKLSIFKTITFSILSIVSFDILCTAFEWCVSKIRENTLYNKLIKMEKKREDEKSIKKMEERLNKIYYDDINLAKKSYQSLKTLSEKNNFSNTKISDVLNNLKSIIVALEKEPILYTKVTFLFEVQLPEFYSVLSCYAILFEKGSEIDSHSELQKEYVNKFFEATETLKNEILSIDENTDCNLKGDL